MSYYKSMMVTAIKIFVISISLIVFLKMTVSARDSEHRVICRVETDKNILPAGAPQKAIVKVTLDASKFSNSKVRPFVNLAIVIDRSGSMSGEKIKQVKNAAIEAIHRLEQQDIFSVVFYDHQVETVIPAQDSIKIKEVEGKIRNVRAGGNTALFGGISRGAFEVRKNLSGSFVHRIILLSDGLANIGPGTPEDLGRLGVALVKEEISVTTIGVGIDYNEDLMARLSQKSDGNSYFVESGSDLSTIFFAELGDVLNVVAKKVRVVIECQEGVTPLTIIGREGRIKGNRAEFFMNQLYGGQEKYALIEVEIPNSRENQTMKIATAEIYYQNPITLKDEISKGYAQARFSKNMATVMGSTNMTVQKEYLLNVNALAEEEAISLSDEGKKEEAVRTLKTSAKKLKFAGKVHEDKDLLSISRDLEKQAEKIAKEGMTKKNRKTLRTKSFQMKQQQIEK